MGMLETLKRSMAVTFGSSPSIERKSAVTNSYMLYMNGLGNVFAFNNIGLEELVSNYRSIPPLYTAITKISAAVGSLPVCLIDKKSKEKVFDHDLLTLLNSPNKDNQKTRKDLLRDLTVWKILCGDGYLYAGGLPGKPPVQLFVLNSPRMTVQPDDNGYAGTYTYTNAFQSMNFVRQKLTDKFLAEGGRGELLPISNFNPNFSSGDLRGMSEIVPLYFELNQYLEASKHNLGLLKNGARPSGALVIKDKSGSPAQLNDDAFKRLKDMMEENYQGAAGSGKPLILEGGLEWQEMSLTPKEMDFVKSKDGNEQQIYKVLQVPIQVIMDVGATYNNLDAAKLEFYENRIVPFGLDILGAIGRFLLPLYKDGDKYDLGIDPDQIDVLSFKRNQRRQVIESSTTLTLNEKRQQLGEQPIVGGDAVFTVTGFAIAGPDAKKAAPLTGNNPNNLIPIKKKVGSVEVKTVSEGDLMSVAYSIKDPGILATTQNMAEKVYEELVARFGQDVVDEVQSSGAFDLTQAVQDFIKQSSTNLITQIDDTTQDAIREELAAGIAASETIDELADRIGSVFDDASEARALTIATTESTYLAGYGAREALNQAGITKTTWLAVLDSHTRDTHAALDQTDSDNDGYFHIGPLSAQYPGDWGDPAEDINCRCAITGALGANDGTEGAGILTTEQKHALWHKREEKRKAGQIVLETMARKVFAAQRSHVMDRFNTLIRNGVR